MAKRLPVNNKFNVDNIGIDDINGWINTAEGLARNAGYNTVGKFSTIRTVTKSVSEITDVLPATRRSDRAVANKLPGLISNFPNYNQSTNNSTDKLIQDLNVEAGGTTGVIDARGKTLSQSMGTVTDDNTGIEYDADKENNGRAQNAATSLTSNLSMVPRNFTDLNTAYTSPLTTAFDTGRNRFQDLVNGTLAKVDPNLEAAAAVGFAVATNEGGIKSLTKRSGSTAALIGILTGKVDAVTTSQKIRQITYPERRRMSTTVSNVLRPFSEIDRDLSRAISNPIDAVGRATGTDTRAIKLGAGIAKELGVFGSTPSIGPRDTSQNNRTYNTVLRSGNNFEQPSAINDPRIQNIIGSKNAALVSSGASRTDDPVQNLSVLGKSLADNYELDKTRVYDFSQKEVANFVGGDLDEINDRIKTEVASAEEELQAFSQPQGAIQKQTAALKSLGQPEKQGNDGSVKFGNQLAKYNTYNYIITLGILNAEEFNNPKSLGERGFSQIIAKSGGGELDKRITTFEEDSLGGEVGGSAHAEYFIDDLEIDVVIAPSQNTGVGVGTNITFNLIEPYSMGKFLEAIKLASEELGFKNFSKVPFCLRIEFKGYDQFGKPISDSDTIKPRFFPIMINNVEFDVSGRGSTYGVTAVAYSDVAHEDMINSVKTDIKSSGRLVHEVLENSLESVARNINSHVEELEEADKIAGYDRVLILFPKDKKAIPEAVNGTGVNQQDLVTVQDQETIRRGTTEAAEVDDPDTVNVTKENIFSAPPKIYKTLKAWSMNKNNVNELGLSPVAVDSNQPKGADFPSAAQSNDPETQINDPSKAETSPPVKSAVFQYEQGTRITEIIEDVLLSSQYAFDAPGEKRDDGKKKWFKIETYTFIETDEKIEEAIGRPRMTYVYSVIPFYPDEAKFQGSKESPKNTKELKAIALKEYDYIYTGKNQDIIDFDLNFNNAFFQLVMSDLNKGNSKPGNSTKGTDPQPETALSSEKSETNNEQGGSVALGTRVSRTLPKGQQLGPENSTKRRIAEQFHDRLINSEVDMITANMQIWGDPFYIPLDSGNNREERAGPNATQGGSMDYTYHEVCCNINFLTPLDYPNKPGHFVMNFPELVRPFSGYFQILAVTNSFSGGKFTQDLKLVRRPRQTDKETGTKGVTETENKKSLAAREAIENQALGRGARPTVQTDSSSTAQQQNGPQVSDENARGNRYDQLRSKQNKRRERIQRNNS